jgi:hypothetical protein
MHATRRRFCLVLPSLVLLATAAACADPRPGPIRAMEPRPNPPPAQPTQTAAAVEPTAAVSTRLRRDPWLARFWEELTPAQQRRVAAAMQRRRGAGGQAADPGGSWDVLGLEERVALVSGRAPRLPRPAAAVSP